jgi:hypothetical protein
MYGALVCQVLAKNPGTTMTPKFSMLSSFRVPVSHRSRRPTQRLRSFYLSPKGAAAELKCDDSPQADLGRTNSQFVERKLQPNFVVPLSGSTIVTFAIIASIFFIISISLAFLGADIEDPHVKMSLDNVAETSPGVCFLLLLWYPYLCAHQRLPPLFYRLFYLGRAWMWTWMNRQ